MYLVVNTDDLIYALKPQYICMTGLDGRCTVNQYPTAYPRTVRDGTKGYFVKENGKTIPVNEDFVTSRTNYGSLTEICGTTEVRGAAAEYTSSSSDIQAVRSGGVVLSHTLYYNVIIVLCLHATYSLG